MRRDTPQKELLGVVGSGGAWGLIAFVAVGFGLSNWLAIFALLGVSAVAGIERHGLNASAINSAVSHYLIAIAASKLAHLALIATSTPSAP
jgi:hypothetical protein